MNEPSTSSAAPAADLPFRPIAALVREHAATAPRQPALVDDRGALDYGTLDALMDRVAATLQRDAVGPGESIAICAVNSTRSATLFLGALRAGVVVAPLAASVTPASFRSMVADSGARLLLVDASADAVVGDGAGLPPLISVDSAARGTPFEDWIAAPGSTSKDVEIDPAMPFNIIYSSGTTGTPKGIVQPHGMRWTHVMRGGRFGYSRDTVTLLATPLYSNTTLVVFFPTIAFGGTVVLMDKFDVDRYLALAERHRVTHTMLVPVQYQRLMASPRFADHDLSSFRMKFCTSAPFAAALKADVLARWPGGLVEFYGMTEGGGTCILAAHEHPDKLHTVGRPSEGHDIRVIDEAGRELPPGATGEVVGHSAG
jgi:acyl-CoA synthetase (AMP-forming)/AMP-acid ligase II